MKALLIYPLFPKSFWSFDKAIALAGRQAILPPLGLVTVAGILPQDWDLRLVDRNVEELSEADWDWAELVIFSGMIVQKPDMLAQIKEAKRRGKSVAVGWALCHGVASRSYLKQALIFACWMRAK